MGFLDKITDGTFKTAQDGRKLFFHWGQGYIIPSDSEYQRLRKQTKIGFICFYIYLFGLILINNPIITDFLGIDPLTLYLFMLLGPVPMELWSYIQCRHLERSDEKFDFDTIQLRLKPVELDALDLWIIELLSIALAVAGMIGIYFFFIHWWDWRFLLLLALIVGTVIFAYVAVRSAKTLMVKNRQGNRDS